jgi:hypothetical protein
MVPVAGQKISLIGETRHGRAVNKNHRSADLPKMKKLFSF